MRLNPPSIARADIDHVKVVINNLNPNPNDKCLIYLKSGEEIGGKSGNYQKNRNFHIVIIGHASAPDCISFYLLEPMKQLNN